jgi:hypothetical protein
VRVDRPSISLPCADFQLNTPRPSIGAGVRVRAGSFRGPSEPGVGLASPPYHRDWAHPLPHLHRDLRAGCLQAAGRSKSFLHGTRLGHVGRGLGLRAGRPGLVHQPGLLDVWLTAVGCGIPMEQPIATSQKVSGWARS